MDLPEQLARADVSVTLGVDTHKDAHVAVALDGLGRRLGSLSVPATPAGYRTLVDWASGYGAIEQAGVEGTGSFGAGLARFLKTEGIQVREVIRPKRRDQYRCGKSDPIDAEAAARAVLAGTATGEPKGADGQVEMIRTLRAAPLGSEGAYAGGKPAQGFAHHRSRRAKERAVQALYGQAGLQGIAFPSRRPPRRRCGGHQVRAALGGPSLLAALRRDLRARRAVGPAGGPSRASVGRRRGR